MVAAPNCVDLWVTVSFAPVGLVSSMIPLKRSALTLTSACILTLPVNSSVLIHMVATNVLVQMVTFDPQTTNTAVNLLVGLFI